MPTNLTGSTIAATYDQLLHIDGGPTATPQTVYSGTGVATMMKLGTVSVEFENIKLDGNTISSVNTNGDLNFTPNGTGSVVIPKVTFSDQSQARTALGLGTMATQNSGAVTITGGSITNVVFTGSFTGITLIESDKFSTKNGSDGVSLEDNDLYAEGTSTDIDIDIYAKGAGEVNLTSKFGYDTGVGGTVTQATSRTTGVTLNKLSGQITMFAGTLAGHEAVEFVLTNSFIAATDVVMVNIATSTAANKRYYTATVTDVQNGQCTIALGNHDNGALPATGTDAPVLNFVVLKGANA